MSRVLARAPNRIDLAGGTLDIQPLYQILPGCLTVNLAISVESEAEVEALERGRPTTIHAEDLGRSTELADLAASDPEPDLRLIVEAARALSPPCPLSIRTHNHAPRGSGLGASSALTICLLGAIAHLFGRPRTIDDLVRLAASVEVGVLGVPTGTQDHYAAALGGALSLSFLPGGVGVERLPVPPDFRDALEETILLSYTGAPHDSGATNWGVVRSGIDGRPRVRAALEAIRDIAVQMREAFLDRDIRRIGKLVAADGAQRRKLERGVVPPEVDRVMKEARQAGAIGSRLSGAGGGGTLVTVVPPARKETVLRVYADSGFEPVTWSIATTGLKMGTVTFS
jgi:D-glycero-alpha-D-manno-heptose-7-phosphate kinase